MRRLLPGLLALGLLAACTDVQAPLRSERYEWRLSTPDGPVSFHWPRERLPLRVWVEDEAGLPAHATQAIADWKGAFLYGELDAELTGDSTRADILLRLAPPPGVVPGFRGARLGSLLAPECQGATDLEIDGTTLAVPVRVYVSERLAGPGLDACYGLTVLHELGHAFGIWRHSVAVSDVMFADPVADQLSRPDRQTIEYLYHFPSDLVPAPRAGP